MLEYSLHENPLTDRKDDYAAQTHSKTVYTREQFIDLMLQRGTLVTKTDIVAVLNNIEETVTYVIKNGGTLNLPLMNIGFSISGVFESALDTFDPNRHKLHVNVSKGTLLRDAEKEVNLTKVNMPSPQPQILEVKDSVSGKVDEILTAGRHRRNQRYQHQTCRRQRFGRLMVCIGRRRGNASCNHHYKQTLTNHRPHSAATPGGQRLPTENRYAVFGRQRFKRAKNNCLYQNTYNNMIAFAA